MPLNKSGSKESIGQNIRTEQAAGKPHSQAVAIALDVARRARADGGLLQSAKIHTGPIHSAVAGRTDHLPVHVPSGSYVIPADIVSGMGEGNTNAGFKNIKRMFGGLPRGAGKQPYDHKGGPYGGGSSPYNIDPGKPYGEPLPGGHAAGGKTGKDVKVVVAGGEYTLTPEEVMAAGDGDMDRGHRVLDDFVKQMRSHIVKTMSKLPGPKRD